MKLTRDEVKTVSFYNDNARSWSDEHFELDYWKEEFENFKKFLPKGKILEIGCGGGRDAKVLISKGYDYIGTDIAKNFVNVARKNNPKARFLVRSVYDLKFPEDFFDGLWCSATLLHIPKNKIKQALKEIKRVIKQDGVGFISVKQGVGEETNEKNRRDR